MLCIRCCKSHCSPGLLTTASWLASWLASRQPAAFGRKGSGSSTLSAKACNQVKAAVMCKVKAAVMTTVRHCCCCRMLAKGCAEQGRAMDCLLDRTKACALAHGSNICRDQGYLTAVSCQTRMALILLRRESCTLIPAWGY